MMIIIVYSTPKPYPNYVLRPLFLAEWQRSLVDPDLGSGLFASTTVQDWDLGFGIRGGKV